MLNESPRGTQLFRYQGPEQRLNRTAEPTPQLGVRATHFCSIENDALELGWRAERHLARENGGGQWQRLSTLRGRIVKAQMKPGEALSVHPNERKRR